MTKEESALLECDAFINKNYEYEQSAQKPVFWMHEVEEAPFEGHQVTVSPNQDEYYTIPIYTHPAPSQEPVAWMYKSHEGETIFSDEWNKYYPSMNVTKLYTHPHQWQGLTDDEIDKFAEMYKDIYIMKQKWQLDTRFFARAIEQALRSKNGY